MDKLFLLVNQLSRKNIFAPSKKKKLVLKTTTTATDYHNSNMHNNFPHLDFITIIYVQDIPKNICNRIQAKKSIQRHPLIMTDADYDYIQDEIECREK